MEGVHNCVLIQSEAMCAHVQVDTNSIQITELAMVSIEIIFAIN